MNYPRLCRFISLFGEAKPKIKGQNIPKTYTLTAKKIIPQFQLIIIRNATLFFSQIIPNLCEHVTY